MSRTELAETRRWVVKIGSALLTRNGQGLDRAILAPWVEQMAARRLDAQTPESTLTAQADYVLRNDSSLAHLQAAAEQLCTKLLAEGGAGKEL